MRKFVLVLTLASLFLMLIAGSAFAAADQNRGSHFVFGMEDKDLPVGDGDRTMKATAENCDDCHGGAALHSAGPHGGYTSTTDKCQACHDVHGTAENIVLLMGKSLTAACQYCHDLTASWAGPYNMAGLENVGSAHRVVGIDVYSYIDTQNQVNEPLSAGILEIPGGTLADGSEGLLMTAGQGQLSGQVFTCNSCHTPHGVRTVEAYVGESQVKYYKDTLDGNKEYLYATTRILKQRPNANQFTAGTVVGIDVYRQYDSRWCAACHMGRDNRIVKMVNHPVNTLPNTDPNYIPGYQFLKPVAAGTGRTSETDPVAGGYTAQKIIDMLADGKVQISGAGAELTRDPRSNAQYALTRHDYTNGGGALNPGAERSFWGYDDVSEITTLGYFGANQNTPYDLGPACQQCHGSAREVEAAFNAVSTNGTLGGNPARASFPHVSANKAFLVEKDGDDFCTNCHNPYNLP